jgi:hypothetical protein
MENDNNAEGCHTVLWQWFECDLAAIIQFTLKPAALSAIRYLTTNSIL